MKVSVCAIECVKLRKMSRESTVSRHPSCTSEFCVRYRWFLGRKCGSLYFLTLRCCGMNFTFPHTIGCRSPLKPLKHFQHCGATSTLTYSAPCPEELGVSWLNIRSRKVPPTVFYWFAFFFVGTALYCWKILRGKFVPFKNIFSVALVDFHRKLRQTRRRSGW